MSRALWSSLHPPVGPFRLLVAGSTVESNEDRPTELLSTALALALCAVRDGCPIPPSSTAVRPPPLSSNIRPPMVDAPTPEDKSGPKVQAMFGSVAPVYDRLNHLLSLSLDRWWRRRSSRSLNAAREGTEVLRVLDLCCGTGDQAISLQHRGYRVAAADFCIPMLALANPKFDRVDCRRPSPLAADAMLLPFADRSFDALTVSFGIRNVADLGVALDEIRRVLAPGGQLRILEFTMPRNPVIGVGYRFYFRHILPLIGRALSRHDSAYSYLPGSVLGFPQRDAFIDHLERAGLTDPSWKELSFGTVCLYSATRP